MSSIAIVVRSMDRPTLDQALASIAAQGHAQVTALVVAACGPAHRTLPPTLAATEPGAPALNLRLVTHGGRLDRAAAANAGLAAAAEIGADLIGFLDDDDAMLPGHLQAMAAALAQAPASALAFGRTLVRAANGEPLGEMGQPADAVTLLGPPPFHTNAALFRSALLARGVRFDEEFAIGEDVDFWLQCAQHSRFVFVDRISTVWNAELGTSGAGAGENSDASKMVAASERIHAKWMWRVFESQNDWQRRFHVLRFALEYGRLELAERMLAQALQERARDPNTLMFAGALARRSGQLLRAIGYYEQAVALAPTVQRLHDELQALRALHAADTGGA